MRKRISAPQANSSDRALCSTTVGPGINALYAQVLSHWTPRIRHHVKEFYQLDDQKFSTSRGHAAGARGLWAQWQVDVVRTHSALPGPEGERSRWTRSAAGGRDISRELAISVLLPWPSLPVRFEALVRVARLA